MRRLLTALLVALAPAAFAETPTVRVAVLKFGTVNWLMDVIAHNGLDAAEGYRLETVELAGGGATAVAFQSGDVDLFVSDWFWALRQRAAGRDVRYFPYSRAVGRLMARPESGVVTLCDIEGRQVGVVGGPLDKSWLVFRALARRDCGFDPDRASGVVAGAPPLLSQQLVAGSIDAVSTYWHFAARLSAVGAETVEDVDSAVAALGVAPSPPLIGFLWRADRSDADAIARFRRSAVAAGRILRDDLAEWDRVRPLMMAEDDAAFEALRDAFRAGLVVDPWTEADTEAARLLHETMLEIGGRAYEGESGPFDRAVFAE
ncbi:MAG: ABC transporter substrate-binding protein [Rhodobacteraceae bacterium]|nr:MAG: ABC transporter substrate-binding protein [Paracoccaceae bacterium]